jgi:hypothetical protein
MDGRPLFLRGPAFFDELITYARAHTSAQTKLAPSSYLDVEVSKDQQIILDPMAETRGRIIQDANGEVL